MEYMYLSLLIDWRILEYIIAGFIELSFTAWLLATKENGFILLLIIVSSKGRRCSQLVPYDWTR